MKNVFSIFPEFSIPPSGSYCRQYLKPVTIIKAPTSLKPNPTQFRLGSYNFVYCLVRLLLLSFIFLSYFLTENQFKACHTYSIDEVRTMYDSYIMTHTVVQYKYSDTNHTILAYIIFIAIIILVLLL